MIENNGSQGVFVQQFVRLLITVLLPINFRDEKYKELCEDNLQLPLPSESNIHGYRLDAAQHIVKEIVVDYVRVRSVVKFQDGRDVALKGKADSSNPAILSLICKLGHNGTGPHSSRIPVTPASTKCVTNFLEVKQMALRSLFLQNMEVF